MTEYDSRFLGIELPLPKFSPARVGDILQLGSLAAGGLATYPNYAVTTDKKHRAPAFAVLHIDQKKFQKTTRSDNWQIDTRVGAEWQLDNSYYANNPWDKGHMADRESAGWGSSLREAQVAADETFFYSNACLQHMNLNQDEWLALEQWIMELKLVKNGRVTVFTGPVFGDTPRIVTPTGRPSAIVPVGFFKVICFINKTTSQLDVRAFVVYQDTDALKDLQGRKTFNFANYQSTITEIERLTGLLFPNEVYERNPLLFHENADAGARLNIRSFPERIDINQPSDIVHHDTRRIVVADDNVEVYIAAALVRPIDGPKDEWVALANYENTLMDVKEWTLTDKAGHVLKLTGVIEPGGSMVLRGAQLRPVTLPDNGGVITLFNAAGERIDLADYTKKDIDALRRAKPNRNLPLNFHTYRTPLRPDA